MNIIILTNSEILQLLCVNEFFHQVVGLKSSEKGFSTIAKSKQ